MNFDFVSYKNNNELKRIQQLQKLKLQLQLQKSRMLAKPINETKSTIDTIDTIDTTDNKEKIIEHVEDTIKCMDDNASIINLGSMKEEILNDANFDTSSQNKYMVNLINLINKILNIDDDVFFYNLIKDKPEYPEVKLCDDITGDNSFKNKLKHEYKQYYLKLLTNNNLNNNIALESQDIKNEKNVVLDNKILDIATETKNEENIVLKIENLETETEVSCQNKIPKKSCLDYNKIRKIQNDNVFATEITNDDLLGKMNNMVKKVYRKLEIEINKDAVNYMDILSNKNTKNNITNIICSIILDKIDKLIN